MSLAYKALNGLFMHSFIHSFIPLLNKYILKSHWSVGKKNSSEKPRLSIMSLADRAFSDYLDMNLRYFNKFRVNLKINCIPTFQEMTVLWLSLLSFTHCTNPSGPRPSDSISP